MTFNDVYDSWSKEKFEHIFKSNINGYIASYNICTPIYNKVSKDLKTIDLQNIIDISNKNYPTLKKVRVLFNQMYKYAMKHDICHKDYSQYIDIVKHKKKNPKGYKQMDFTKENISTIWSLSNDKYYQIVLMLIYTGVRISELLNLKKENIYLDKQYFEIIISKTYNGIRKVPIADVILPFFKSWYSSSNSIYLLHTQKNEVFLYRNYYDSYFKPLMKTLNLKQTPHCCRHTCITLLAEAGVDQTTIKTIVGHSGAMTLTEKVYTHLDIKVLITAVNKIHPLIEQ